MHVAHLDAQASPPAVASAPRFLPEEWRSLILAHGAPGRRPGDNGITRRVR